MLISSYAVITFCSPDWLSLFVRKNSTVEVFRQHCFTLGLLIFRVNGQNLGSPFSVTTVLYFTQPVWNLWNPLVNQTSERFLSSKQSLTNHRLRFCKKCHRPYTQRHVALICSELSPIFGCIPALYIFFDLWPIKHCTTFIRTSIYWSLCVEQQFLC